MLKCGDLTKEQQNEYLDIVIDESTRLAALATNVLNLSKIETQSILTETLQFNIGVQIRQCILLVDPKMETNSIDVIVDIEDFTISGNKELLSQVWINLIDNAIKFTPEFGQIEVKVKRQMQEALITICDNGCGIDAETQKHIFDKFYQADTSRSTQGNGIGLAIVDKIVKLHGGKIFVNSALNKGTTFTVSLPITHA